MSSTAAHAETTAMTEPPTHRTTNTDQYPPTPSKNRALTSSLSALSRRGILSNFYSLLAVLLLGSVFAVIMVSVEGTERGFYCNDDSITKPYVHPETISAFFCVVLSSLMIFGTIVLVDLHNIVVHVSQVKSKSGSSNHQSVSAAHSLKSSQVQRYLLITVQCLIFMGAGVFIEQIVVNLTKKLVGELRPHFISVCFPNKSDYYNLCKNQSFPLTDYIKTTCPNALSADDVKEARVSFPSGHSSFIFYGAFLGIIYIKSQLLVPSSLSRGFGSPSLFGVIGFVFQSSYFVIAWWVAVTRVRDYWHHPWDAMTGSFIGILVALFIWRVSPLKYRRHFILNSSTSSSQDRRQQSQRVSINLEPLTLVSETD